MKTSSWEVSRFCAAAERGRAADAAQAMAIAHATVE
jgi:hypothetical protein